MNRRVSIYFCGGCNPRIDRGQIAKEVSRLLTGLGFKVLFNTLEADFIVFLIFKRVYCQLCAQVPQRRATGSNCRRRCGRWTECSSKSA